MRVGLSFAFTLGIWFAASASAQRWIDVKTGETVPSFPIVTDPNGPPGQKTDWIRPNAGDPTRAYDPRTGRNFYYDPIDCRWKDAKTGKVVPSFPVVTDPNGPPGQKTDWVRPNAGDPTQAYDPRTGRNFAQDKCPPKRPQAGASCPPPQPATPKTSAPEAEPAKTIGLVSPPPTDPTAAGLLAYHNKLRAEVGSPPLQWSTVLTEHAQGYARIIADTGQPEHSPRLGRETERENVSLGMRGVGNPLQLAQVWGAERRYFRSGTFPDISTTGEWSDAGHYSQMVWSLTTKVGCGFARGRRVDALVCRYSPPGNQDGEPVIRIGLSYEFAGVPCAPAYQETDVPKPELPNKEVFKLEQRQKLDDPH